MLEPVVATLITSAARLITGARSLWIGCGPDPVQRIYFANHSSHGDFVLLWASLPRELRKLTRPVAGADYWNKSLLRRYIIRRVFNGVLIDRERKEPGDNPLQPMLDALEQGHSLIIFPEGTRNQDEGLLPFKSGIFHLARTYPQAQLIPVWIANLNRVMPKGRVLPLPLLCTTSFGAPLQLEDDESKEYFLQRSRDALLTLAPEQH
ncbi:1-acyl-sn-glycerol-3-phosphate acyltransferase [Pseudomonas fuscovaginae UPB0736]|uniref:1-acyl-sn-glycerol-3-phosphate acyltransferases n=1 Tax=Pseudomonas asplenii TaxID=53407 RepID=A0A1H6LTN9_9PSED|nr:MULTISPECIES: lysophospholipid acyltransferase family protein [Pseudomonas]UUQ67586.1 1-acyl-sn-glycerol-3-phosphate acyltransferase [Pseudomonas fuscovaginae UPB0736]UZE29146.1 1-acyl-sn-glycerol-3-phosphate acyltransferase [Pseudomonas asplenii]SDS41063.1 1-acyl-sn-glycerol-3-phosphate acyltransferases [Pseudomonas asplenii]SEH88391.1 1-acyl-sn-glycerol-3-phosphate acyltransferases [Pseudomonas fuscovaginae]